MEPEWRHPNGSAFIERLAQGAPVSFHRRGVGGSQRETADFSLEAQVADVAAVADHLQLERFDLWGIRWRIRKR